jgi:hypothetical protein
MWVRPILTMSSHSACALAAIASRSAAPRESGAAFTLTAAAMYIADGNESFDDCAMLT